MVADEVDRAGFIDGFGNEHRHARPHKLLALLGSDLMPLLTVDPLGSLALPDAPLEHQHVVQYRISVLGMLLGQRLDTSKTLTAAGSVQRPLRRRT